MRRLFLLLLAILQSHVISEMTINGLENFDVVTFLAAAATGADASISLGKTPKRNRELVASNSAVNQLLNNIEIIVDAGTLNAYHYDSTTHTLGIPFTWAAIDINVNDIICNNLSLDTLTVTSVVGPTATNPTYVDVTLSATGIVTSCNAGYNWSAKLLDIPSSGGGTATASTLSSSNVALTLRFQSPKTLSESPPTTVSVTQNVINLNLNTLDFQGGFTSGVLDAIKGITGALQTFIQNKINSAVTDKVTSAVSSSVQPLLDTMTNYITPFLQAAAIPPTTPLQEEALFMKTVSPPGVQLLNWNNFDVVQLLNGLSYNGSSAVTNTSSLNSMIGGYLGNGGLSLATQLAVLSQEENPIASTSVTVTKTTFVGLDTLTSVDVMQPVPGTLTIMKEALGFQKLGATITMKIVMSIANGKSQIFVNDPGTTSAPLTESIQVYVELDNINVAMDLIVAITQEKLNVLQIGSLISNLMPCLTSVLNKMKIASMTASLGNLVGPVVSGFIEPEMDTLINNVRLAAMEMYLPVLLKGLPAFVASNGTIMANNAIDNFVTSEQNKTCVPFTIPQPEEFVDFRNNTYWNFVTSKLKTLYTDSNGDIDFMTMINKFNINEYSGSDPSIFVSGSAQPLFSTSVDLSPAGIFNVSLSNLMISGLNNISRADLLDPISAYVLHNSITVGEYKPFGFSMNIAINFAGLSSFHDNFTISAGFDHLNLIIDILVKYDFNMILNLPVVEVLNFWCYLAPLNNLDIPNFNGTAGNIQMHLDCANPDSCTSTGIVGLSETFSKFQSLSNFTTWLNSVLKNTGAIKSIDTWITTALQTEIATAQANCPAAGGHNANFQAAATSPTAAGPTFQWPSGVVLVAIGVALVNIIMFSVLWFNRLKFHLSNPKDVLVTSTSLFRHKAVPLAAKIAVPLLIFINTGLFMSAHAMTGASVDITMSIAGETIELNQIQQITIANTIQQAFQSGAYSLAILIGLMSGVWPYIKLELMMIAWFMPPRWLGRMGKTKLISTMDKLGKWSLIDLYVLALFMVAFCISIKNPSNTLGVLNAGFFNIIVLVNPKFGIYGFVMAAMGAILLCQIVGYYHRVSIDDEEFVAIETPAVARRKSSLGDKTVPVDNTEKHWSQTNSLASKTNASPAVFERKKALIAHLFKVQHGVLSETKVRPSIMGSFVVTILIVCSIFCLIAGSYMDSVYFTFEGLAAAAIQWDNASATSSYSLWSMTMFLGFRQSLFNGISIVSAGVTFIQASFICLATIVPSIQMTLLLVVWFMPLTVKWQFRFSSLFHLLDDWSALDVYLISLVLCIMEVPNLAQNMGSQLGSTCTLLEQILPGATPGEICMNVAAGPRPGLYFLVAGLLLFLLVRHIIPHMLYNNIVDRSNKENTKIPPHYEEVEGEHFKLRVHNRVFLKIVFFFGLIREEYERNKSKSNADIEMKEGKMVQNPISNTTIKTDVAQQPNNWSTVKSNSSPVSSPKPTVTKILNKNIETKNEDSIAFSPKPTVTKMLDKNPTKNEGVTTPPAVPKKKKALKKYDFPIVIAQHMYEKRNADELTLIPGMLIQPTIQMDDGWWFGINCEGGAQGYFPSNFVAELPNDDERLGTAINFEE